MSFKEYGSYDGMGLAELVRKKQVTASELLAVLFASVGAADVELFMAHANLLRQNSATNFIHHKGRFPWQTLTVGLSFFPGTIHFRVFKYANRSRTSGSGIASSRPSGMMLFWVKPA